MEFDELWILRMESEGLMNYNCGLCYSARVIFSSLFITWAKEVRCIA
jgi:hypothetical protein